MDLSKCIMTRVSHDLAGITGALYNTVELLELDPSFAPEATGLLKESTGFLMARLKFFRALFGLENAPVDTALAQNYLKTLSAPVTLKGDIPDRFTLGAVFIMAHALLRGGEITLNKRVMTATGQIKLDEDSAAFLQNAFDQKQDCKTPEPTPKSVGAAWLATYSKENNMPFQMHCSDQMMLIERV